MFSPEASTWKGRLRVPLSDRIHCPGFPDGADDGVRTRGLLLGKQACCHCTTSASRGTGSGPMTLGLWGRPVDGPAGPAVSRAAGGRPLSAYSIAGARRLDMTSFLGMSALARGGMPHVVEPAGFEPATFPLRTGRPATGRRPRNAPDRIRACNLTIRGPTPCPIGLQGRASAHATACVPARAGETDHGAGMVPDEAEEGTRLACHRSRARRVYGVACGRRSRHEPLRAPGRTRSGDLPLTRRTLCLLSYRGECRKPPAVRRRPPRTRRMGPDREEGHAIVRSEGRAVFAARACADPSGSRRDGSAASRAMEESNLRLRFWRPSGCRCPDGAFIVSALRFSTMPCRPCPRRHGMVCVPDGRPTERVPPACAAGRTARASSRPGEIHGKRYSHASRIDRIRTCDPMLPKHVRYQTAPQSDIFDRTPWLTSYVRALLNAISSDSGTVLS